jgi:hypothetical protein
VAFFAIGTSGVLLISPMKKLREQRNGNDGVPLTTCEGRFPVAHVPEAKAAVSFTLILAQSDVPTTGALSLMMKWEKVVAEGKSDAIAVCCTCILQNCVVSTVVIRV